MTSYSKLLRCDLRARLLGNKKWLNFQIGQPGTQENTTTPASGAFLNVPKAKAVLNDSKRAYED